MYGQQALTILGALKRLLIGSTQLIKNINFSKIKMETIMYHFSWSTPILLMGCCECALELLTYIVSCATKLIEKNGVGQYPLNFWPKQNIP